jgi:peptidoglycan/LPS O-acetylase OafA/YrhL
VTAARNAAIVALLALAVFALPGGGTAADFFAALLFVLITVFLVLFAARMYLENRVAIHSLGDRDRALMYGSLGVAVWTLAAGPKLFNSGIGTLVWFALMGGAGYSLYLVWRHQREY